MDFKTGEKKVKEYFNSCGYEVEDVSDNSDYWNKDIDLIVKTAQGDKGVEVKWDSRIADTGNLFIETDNLNSIGGCGWYKFCEADYLAYGDSVNNVCHLVSIDELHKFMDAKGHNLSEARTGNSWGKLLPLDYLQNYTTVQTVNL